MSYIGITLSVAVMEFIVSRKTSKKHSHQIMSRKMNRHSVWRMYVDEFNDLHVALGKFGIAL